MDVLRDTEIPLSHCKVPSGGGLLIKPYHIWCNVALSTSLADRPETLTWFPALIDTGCGDNFLISKEHLQSLAGLSISKMSPVYRGGTPLKKRINNEALETPFFEGRLWIKGDGGAALDIDLDHGFGICQGGPRVPIMGAKALVEGGMCLVADYRHMRLSVYHRPARVILGQYLVGRGAVTAQDVVTALKMQSPGGIECVAEMEASELRTVVNLLCQMACRPVHVGMKVIDIATSGCILPPTAALSDGECGKEQLGRLLVSLKRISQDVLDSHIEAMNAEYP